MLFFFFKQKTAYEMRISDWSSDVCSSDLQQRARDGLEQRGLVAIDDPPYRQPLVPVHQAALARLAGQYAFDIPTPNICPVRNTAERNFRAVSVASIAAGGLRQLSQLPQVGGGVSPKCRSRIARRHPAVSTKIGRAHV